MDQLPEEHEAHAIIGNYLGQLSASILLLLSSERIVFGGGVMQTRGLLPYIRRRACHLLNGYPLNEDVHGLEGCIVAPGLGERSGLSGAVALAMASRGERHGL